MIFGKLLRKLGLPDEKASGLRKVTEEIENLYLEYSTHFGRHVFNIEDFQKRYDEVLKYGGDEEAFLLEELAFVKKFSRKTGSAQKSVSVPSHKKQSSGGGAVQSIQNEFRSRYKKYSSLKMSKNVPEEVTYLGGALCDFFKNEHKVVIGFFRTSRDADLKNYVSELKSYETLLGFPVRDRLPKAFYDLDKDVEYVTNSDEAQKRSHKVLKECFCYFDTLRKLIMHVDNTPSLRNFYTARGFYKKRDEIMKAVDTLLFDFRLKGLL